MTPAKRRVAAPFASLLVAIVTSISIYDNASVASTEIHPRSGWTQCGTVHFSIVLKAKGVGCRRAGIVTRRTRAVFCNGNNKCSAIHRVQGMVRVNGWRCRIVRWNFSERVRCKRGRLRAYRLQSTF